MRTNQDGKVIPIAGARAPQGLEARSDDELMELGAAEVREAFAELLRRYQGRVRSYCRRWDAQRGDDLAQEVFLQLWQARGRYRPRGQFPVYLFTIVRNRCRNARRSLFRAPVLEPLAPEQSDPARGDQLDRMLEQERARRVSQGVATLPPRLREALLLRFGEGMSYADIAAIVRAPQATMRSRVFHGLRRLQQELAP